MNKPFLSTLPRLRILLGLAFTALAVQACVTGIESSDAELIADEPALEPAMRGPVKKIGVEIAELEPGPGPTATATTTLTPPNCVQAGDCTAKCNAGAAAFGAGLPASSVAACLQVCIETGGGANHLPGHFMMDCLINHPPNGCGPQGQYDVVPDGSWGGCCDVHDACYTAGGDHLARCACDKAMGICISQSGGGGIAGSYMAAVRNMGCDNFNWVPGPAPAPTPGGYCGDVWNTTCEMIP